MPERTILLVCTGNLCRSPMTEAMLRDRIRRAAPGSSIVVRSAGLRAPPNQPASVFAQQVMRERGLDIADHRSHMLLQTDLDQADLVLAMTSQQARAIKALFARTEHKVYQLGQMARKERDVEDPYGYPIEDYRAAASDIESLLDAAVPNILRALGISGS